MNDSDVSGVDLARVALRAAMEAAHANGGGQKAKTKPRMRTVRRDGHEPLGLGAAIGALVTERAWCPPAAGATLRERWAAIAAELAGHESPVVLRRLGAAHRLPGVAGLGDEGPGEQTRIIAAANQLVCGASNVGGENPLRRLEYVLRPGAPPRRWEDYPAAVVDTTLPVGGEDWLPKFSAVPLRGTPPRRRGRHVHGVAVLFHGRSTPTSVGRSRA